MAREYREMVDDATGEEVIVVYDDGRYVEHFPDPGWLGAEDDAFQRRMGNYGRTIANMVPQTQEQRNERARDWARGESYHEALAGAYPLATAVGSGVASMSNPLNWMGQSKLAQFAYNQAGAVADEFLDYDPSRQAGDYLDTSVGAAVGDVAMNMAGRVWKGALEIGDRVHNQGFRQFFGTNLPKVANDMTERGYRVTRPSQMFDRDHPARGMVERMEMSAESSALPPRIMRENEEYNKRRLNNVFAKALGLKGNYDYVDESVLLEATQQLNKRYQDLQGRMPSVIELDDRVANRIVNQPWFVNDIVGSKQVPDLQRYLRDLQDPNIQAVELPTVTPKDLFQLRSDLTNQASNAELGLQSQAILEMVDGIDASVASRIDDPDWVSDFAQAREQWEVLFAAQGNGVIGKEGAVNPLALARNMSYETNFGRSALYGDSSQFTNEATADLAGDLAALSKPETYANSRTTDRGSWLQFVKSIVDDPMYAAATAANTGAVNQLMAQATSGNPVGNVLQEVGTATAGALPPYLLTGTGKQIPGMLGSAVGAQEQLGTADWAYDQLRQGFLPDEEVRDAALGVFTGTENNAPRRP